MSPTGRLYRYVGPEELRRAVVPGTGGTVIRRAADLDAWAAEQGAKETYTFVVAPDGLLRLAPRRSEHVACAGGGAVLAAGEIGFLRTPDGRQVDEVSNQSTGYCPDPDCWPAVAAALERAGIGHPGGFTHALLFRRCPRCRENNVVREGVFVCVFCDGDLPRSWNVDVPDP
ncbi:hypothetical protein [Streptomyces sp. A012304]|uniref:hypothetical protein n=1 Tax=Streptomyces sp. A012304 TaxID=375446 RepID=UPI00222F6635|nr:hypothetical protein [Streptomyces sp. A012304]GKQ39326.1 hypothetical protein ALMP_58530 [Streptomyces sp. A012304]